MDKIIEILATVGTIAGLYFLSENNSLGFIIGAFSNILWLWHGNSLEKGGMGIMIVNFILFFINLNGMGII